MKKIILKALLFFAILFAVLKSLDVFISTGLKKSQSFFFVDWNSIYSGKINADIIVNGNSKAWHHVSPKILDSICNMSSYNLGIDGYDFIMQKAKYDVYLNHNTSPKVVIHIIGINTLVMRDDLFQKEQFAPYLTDTIIKNATSKYKGYSFFDYHVPLLRYAGQYKLIPNSVISLLGFSDTQKYKNKYKGYEAYNKSWDGTFDTFIAANPNGKSFDINSNSLKLFKNYLETEKQNNTKIFLVYSPTYFESHSYVLNRNEIIKTFQDIAYNTNISFLDYSNLELTKDKSYFYNSQHLNKKGAELFSKILATDLVEVLSNPKSK